MTHIVLKLMGKMTEYQNQNLKNQPQDGSSSHQTEKAQNLPGKLKQGSDCAKRVIAQAPTHQKISDYRGEIPTHLKIICECFNENDEGDRTTK